MGLKLRVNRIQAQEMTGASGATINEFSTDGTLAGNSDTAVPTEKAVKAYVDASPAGTVTLTGAQALSNKSLQMEGGTPLAAIEGTPLCTIGSLTAAMTSAKTDSFVPCQININQTADAGTGNTVGAIYLKTATGIAQTGQLATAMVRTALAHNVFDAYGLQSHVAISANMATVDNNAHLTAISGKITFSNAPTVAKGWITAGLFIIEGAGTVTQMCHGVSIVEEAGSTGAQSLLHLNTDVGTTPAISFASADGSGKTIYTHVPTTLEGSIKVLVNGVAKYIPFYTTE